MDDGEIIGLFLGRSEQAISELSKKYGGICLKLSRNILNNPLDAEGCVNDAYLSVWNSVPPEKPNPLLPYVCRIVRNLSIKKYHSNTAKKRSSRYDVALEELENCLADSTGVEDSCAARELTSSIDRFLRTLKKDDRIMFVRRYWFSDSLPEITELFHISEHNASVRLFRIRKKLRRYLEKEGLFHEP